MVIGPKFTVPAYSKISMMPQPTEEDSSDEELEYADAASGRGESPQSPFHGTCEALLGVPDHLKSEGSLLLLEILI